MASYSSISIAQALDGYDDIIDVRSPSEYADDHLPGAISLPVLDDVERARVGTLYAQVSTFEAKRLGAALIARNVARHLEESLSDRPKSWRPLVYCWRGGMRSGAMAHILSQVGWKTAQLDGGYKAYRRYVIEQLEILPQSFRFVTVCGPTGSGKSRLLQALDDAGAQVLDLERLACHRGSLLGNLPGVPQPSQKTLESRIFDRLRRFDATRPVYVEAESRKVGVLNLPDALLQSIRSAACVSISAPVEARVHLLLEDYAHFLTDPAALKSILQRLTELHGRKTIEAWSAMADKSEWPELVASLLADHYDPAYHRSSTANFENLGVAATLTLPSLDPTSLRAAAITLIKEENKADE